MRAAYPTSAEGSWIGIGSERTTYMSETLGIPSILDLRVISNGATGLKSYLTMCVPASPQYPLHQTP
ncbi:hypothetical protein G9A89_000242 [Geosiphon pyriformis]|nr:hypothetical protein G9A89_000242 [Geosiphon pyriformis]